MKQFLELVGVEGAFVAFAFAVTALFWKADDAISDSFRTDISDTLQNLRLPSARATWPSAFISVFDRFFGEKTISFIRFYRSCIISTAFYFCCCCFVIIFGSYAESWHVIFREFLFAFLIVGIGVNLIGDFASLIETRWCMGKINSATSALKWLILDALFTVCIIFIFVFISFLFPLFILHDTFIDRSLRPTLGLSYTSVWIDILGTRYDSFSLSIFAMIVTTLFTSIWVWAMSIGWAISRNITTIRTVWRIAQYVLPIRTKPLRAVGIAASGALLLIAISAGLIGSVI